MSYGFTYYAPTKVVFGKGSAARAGELTAACGGKKALLHYGGGSAIRSGLLEQVSASLAQAGVEQVRLGGVAPNPRLSLVYAGIELCRREGVDFILAVGGGSVIDSAKAIAYGLAETGDVWELFTKQRQPQACLPVGVVLTIAAAGSEMSNSAVITREEEGLKRSCNNDLSRPRFAVMDPLLTLTLPPYQTACGCADILMHTMERYFTNGGHMELTDNMAEGLMRTVLRDSALLLREPDNYEARADIMWAGSLSHNGLTGCGNDGGDFACHLLEHELSGRYDVAHGAGLSAIWGSWARYVYRDCLERFVRFATAVMGVPAQGGPEDMALCGIAAMEDFYRSLSLPVSLGQLGIAPSERELRDMARLAIASAGGKRGSARVLYEEDLYNIYKAAL